MRQTPIARLLTGDKVVESPVLNAAGASMFRTVVAHGLHALRRSGDPRLAELTNTGVLVWNDFLSPAQHARVREEAEAVVATPPTWEYVEGAALVRRYALRDLAGSHPAVAELADDPRLLGVAEAAERRRLGRSDGERMLEHLVVGEHDEPDPQTDLHVDTFHPTHKLWLYLDDVTDDDAPLVYVPGSHRIDRVRLRHDHRNARTANRGSRRVSDAEVDARGLRPRRLTCGANTLVVANTHGYHHRSVGAVGTSRLSVHMSFRFNPFSPRGWRRGELPG